MSRALFSAVAALAIAWSLATATSLALADDSQEGGREPASTRECAALEARCTTSITVKGTNESAPAAEAAADEASSEDSPSVRLRTIVVEGRADDLVGVARSGSEGAVGQEQLEDRPVLRNAEVLEVIPGFLATQHSGTGKANQYFLRGFNLDHGSDFATRVDGVPMNLPTHAHGQGYLDLNFLIPELVRTVRFHKGPYYAESGDFASAGTASIELFDRLDRGIAELVAGEDAYLRGLVADSVEAGGGDFLYAAEATFYDGPWRLDEELGKYNALLKWTRGDSRDGLSLEATAYHADWTSTDQIPLRAVGSIGRLGFVDPTDGGETDRYSLSSAAWRSGPSSRTRAEVYGLYYALDLFSNFTYFLEDTVAGDQIHQRDRRGVFGGDVVHDWYGDLGPFAHQTRLGLSLRHDEIPTVALRRTSARTFLRTVRSDDVSETAAGLWGESTLELLPALRAIAGLRLDGYRFGVESDLAANSGTEIDGIVSPKIALVAGPWAETEGYANFGLGFHSNDARGTTIRIDPATGDPADRVTPLVRSTGAEVGVRTEAIRGLHSSVSLWLLDLDSELVFVGDAGATEPGPPSRRYGVEWANYYEPVERVALDLDVSWTEGRLRETRDTDDEIPGAIPLAIAAGITGDLPWNFYGALRLRYLGEYPLVESGDVRSGPTTLVNLRLGYRKPDGGWGAFIDVLNLFDSRDRDIAYFYESRLPGEADPVEDVHFHPVEPRTLRVGVQKYF